MDVGDGHGMYRHVCSVVSNASLCPVAATIIRFDIYAYFSIVKIRRHSLVSRRPLPQVQDANSIWAGSQRRTGSIRCASKAPFDLRSTGMPPSGGLQRITRGPVSTHAGTGEAQLVFMKAKVAVVPPPEHRIWCDQCCIRIAPNEEKTMSNGKAYHPRCFSKIAPNRAKSKAK